MVLSASWLQSKNTLHKPVGFIAETSTSRHPNDLYKNGIQRSSFIPAIELLKTRFDVTDLDSGTGRYTAVFRKFGLKQLIFQIIDGYPAHCQRSITTLSHPKTTLKSIRYSNPLRMQIPATLPSRTESWPSGDGRSLSRIVQTPSPNSTSKTYADNHSALLII